MRSRFVKIEAKVKDMKFEVHQRIDSHISQRSRDSLSKNDIWIKRRVFIRAQKTVFTFSSAL